MWFMSYTNDPIVMMFFSHGKVIHQIIFNSTNEWEKKWIRLWNSYSTPRVRVLNCELLRANHLTNHLHAASFFFFYCSPPFKFLMGQGCSSFFSSSFLKIFSIRISSIQRLLYRLHFLIVKEVFFFVKTSLFEILNDFAALTPGNLMKH